MEGGVTKEEPHSSLSLKLSHTPSQTPRQQLGRAQSFSHSCWTIITRQIFYNLPARWAHHRCSPGKRLLPHFVCNAPDWRQCYGLYGHSSVRHEIKRSAGCVAQPHYSSHKAGQKRSGSRDRVNKQTNSIWLNWCKNSQTNYTVYLRFAQTFSRIKRESRRY